MHARMNACLVVCVIGSFDDWLVVCMCVGAGLLVWLRGDVSVC